MSPSLPPGLYRDSLLWCNNGASSSANALSTITKVKIMTSYKACKCDSSITVEACGVAISREVVTLACIRELEAIY